MSVYEDVKKAIQEFLAPELAKLVERVDQNERRAQERHENVMRELAWRFDSLKSTFEHEKRIDALERNVAAKTDEERKAS